MKIGSDENQIDSIESDTMKINHHIQPGDELHWLVNKNMNVRFKCIRTPRVKKGSKFSEKFPRMADVWHGVEFTVPVQNVEIYIETLSDNALEDPTCTETSKKVIFTADEAQSFFPEEPWPNLIHPMSCIWIKFEYTGLKPGVAHKMIKVVHHLESLTTPNRERLLGCPVRKLTQTRAEKEITGQSYMMGMDDNGKMRLKC